MTEEENFDMWADEMEPHVRGKARLYRIQPPEPHNRKVFADLLVYEHDLVELSCWKFYGSYGPKSDGYTLEELTAREAVMKWLAEWDLVELRSIGPEDGEWFATEELLKSEVKTQAYDRKHTYSDE